MTKFKVGDRIIIANTMGYYSSSADGSVGVIKERSKLFPSEWFVEFSLLTGEKGRARTSTTSYYIYEKYMVKQEALKAKEYTDEEWAKTVGE